MYLSFIIATVIFVSIEFGCVNKAYMNSIEQLKLSALSIRITIFPRLSGKTKITLASLTRHCKGDVGPNCLGFDVQTRCCRALSRRPLSFVPCGT